MNHFATISGTLREFLRCRKIVSPSPSCHSVSPPNQTESSYPGAPSSASTSQGIDSTQEYNATNVDCNYAWRSGAICMVLHWTLRRCFMLPARSEDQTRTASSNYWEWLVQVDASSYMYCCFPRSFTLLLTTKTLPSLDKPPSLQ